jgi:signal transduction histidine kinase/CheY-like chemotaxis protein
MENKMKPTLLLRLKFLFVLALLSIGVAGLLAYALAQAKVQKEGEVSANVENYTLLLDQSVTSSVRKIDLTMLGIADQLQQHLKARKQLDGNETNAMLALRKEWHAGEVEFRITDQEGFVRFGPGVDPAKLASYADRPFFEYLRNDEHSKMAVSKPVLGKVSKIWVVVFARRYNQPDGRFAGVIAAAVPVSNFNALLRGIDLGPSGVALLRDADGGLLTRYPEIDGPSGKIGAKIYSKELASIMASGKESVAYHTTNTGDNAERMVSYRKLHDVPFHLIVGMGPDDYLADWRSQAAKTSAAGAGFLLIVIFFAWGLWRSFDASERARAGSEKSLSERDSALADLESQSRLLTEVVESLPYGLVVYDEHRVKQLSNSKFGEILHIPMKVNDRANFTFLDFLRYCDQRGDYTDGEPIDQRYARIVKAMDERRVLGGERRQADGAFIEFRAFPISNGWVALTYLDHTERRKEQEVLGKVQARAQLATESAGIGIWEYDLVSGELFWDAQQCRLHGMEPGTGSNDYGMWLDKLHPDDSKQAQEVLTDALNARNDFVAEFRIVWSDASIHHIRALGRLTFDAVGKPIRMVGTNRDITESVLIAASLKEALDRAEQASLSKSLFLANMSHEIRTPMNAILGLLQLLSSTTLKPNQLDYVGKITSSAKSLLGLLNDILDFSKIEADKLDLAAEPFEVDRLLKEVGVVLSAYVGTKPVDLIYDIDPRIPSSLVGDALRLRQILVNLAGNAIKFTAEGQVVIALKLITDSGIAGDAAILAFEIEDSGIGIAPEVLPLLFNSFTQAEGSTTRRFGGTGLGLAICKKLVELMGGTIDVSSQPGVGSKFVFQIALPIFLGAEPAPSALDLQRQSVLLIEDNPTARDAATKMMEALGWQVEVASTCAEAVAHIGSKEGKGVPFDAVFIDCQLLPVDGWETAKVIAGLEAASIGPQTKYVMLGVNGRDRLDQRTAQEQALISLLIAKPFTADVLRSALEQHRADRSHPDAALAEESRRLDGIRILVVEDNAINQQVAEELLASQGAIVSIASDGRQGVNAIASAKSQYDIVMMDIQMPVMDGYEATHAIRKKLGLDSLPIIGLTANAMASDRELCLQAGMNEHLSKPFELVHMVDVILRLVKGKPHGQASDIPTTMSDLHAASGQDAELADMEQALARMGGLVRVYARAAEGLAKQLPELHPALAHAMDASNIEQVQGTLHTYKGTAATLGLTALSSFLAGMESRLKVSQSLDSLNGDLLELDNLEQHSQSLLIRMLEKSQDKGGATLGNAKNVGFAAAEIAVTLKKLDAYLRDEDYEALAWFGNNIEVFAYLPDATFQRLETAIQDLDFDAAMSACQSALLDYPDPELLINQS